MKISEKIQDCQQQMEKEGIDGWLFYDFRRSNDLACQFLEIPREVFLTRRFFYWIPQKGTPIKVVSSIETGTLDHLPGELKPYKTWRQLEEILQSIVRGKVFMEYSPFNRVPTVSKVDAGTIELIRSFGVEVVSSADLMQKYTSIWDREKWDLHLEAEEVVCQTVEKAWEFIAEQLESEKIVTEYDVPQLIIQEFNKHQCIHEGDPICAVNENSSNPHYIPTKEHHREIKMGDFILIDLWCKKNVPRATYADITRVGVAAKEPTSRQNEIFTIVKDARDAATDLVKKRMAKGTPLMGWEVDQTAREVIESAGYGEYFIHRTGHNIDEADHGSGAHIDNYETQEMRQLLPGTCFSIEPGIYLPGEFGVRLEYDVYLHPDRSVQVTGGIQDSIRCLFK